MIARGGSSPLVWGKLFTASKCPCADRIIPTRVGKTYRFKFDFFRKKDHPHSCGENFFDAGSRAYDEGSSPLVWGKQVGVGSGQHAQGIIPTCVGKTENINSISFTCQDHPHLCGENFFSAPNSYLVQGSSPLVWGKLGGKDESSYALRIIPTCVGKTGAS